LKKHNTDKLVKDISSMLKEKLGIVPNKATIDSLRDHIRMKSNDKFLIGGRTPTKGYKRIYCVSIPQLIETLNKEPKRLS